MLRLNGKGERISGRVATKWKGRENKRACCDEADWAEVGLNLMSGITKYRGVRSRFFSCYRESSGGW